MTHANGRPPASTLAMARSIVRRMKSMSESPQEQIASVYGHFERPLEPRGCPDRIEHAESIAQGDVMLPLADLPLGRVCNTPLDPV